jgi:ABC-type sugar transport system ATPase subunit
MNFLPVVAVPEKGEVALRLQRDGPVLATRPATTGIKAGDRLELGIRPDAMSVAESGELAARVTLVERLGGASLLHAQVSGLAPLLTVELPGTFRAQPGSNIRLSLTGPVHLFDPAGRTIG